MRRLAAENAIWKQYALYCRCCAKSGEHDPDDFETFKNRMAALGQKEQS